MRTGFAILLLGLLAWSQPAAAACSETGCRIQIAQQTPPAPQTAPPRRTAREFFISLVPGAKKRAAACNTQGEKFESWRRDFSDRCGPDFKLSLADHNQCEGEKVEMAAHRANLLKRCKRLKLS